MDRTTMTLETSHFGLAQTKYRTPEVGHKASFLGKDNLGKKAVPDSSGEGLVPF
jgi:hypothetical protein